MALLRSPDTPNGKRSRTVEVRWFVASALRALLHASTAVFRVAAPIEARTRLRATLARSALFFATALGLLVTAPLTSRAQTHNPKEYQIKAVFLFNFVQFVEWP